MLFLDFDEPRKIGDVAVHAVDALDHQQHAAILVAVALQQIVGRLPVVVGEHSSPRAGKNAALENAVVGKGIVENQVARLHEMPNHALIGGMSPNENDRVFDPEEIRKRAFQLAVKILFSGNQPAGGDARAVFLGRGLGGLNHHGVTRHADIVVAGKANQLAAADHRPVVGYRLVDREIGVPQPAFFDHRNPLAKPDILGKFGDVVVFGGSLVVIRPRRRRAGFRAEVFFDRLDHLPAGIELGEDVFRKTAAKAFFQGGKNFHAFERIEADFRNRRVRRQLIGAFPRDQSHLFEDDFRGASRVELFQRFLGSRNPLSMGDARGARCFSRPKRHAQGSISRLRSPVK